MTITILYEKLLLAHNTRREAEENNIHVFDT